MPRPENKSSCIVVVPVAVALEDAIAGAAFESNRFFRGREGPAASVVEDIADSEGLP